MSKLKKALSMLLAAAMVLGMMLVPTTAAEFKDADQITYTEEVAITAGLGLFAGADGNFMPKDTVTRAQMATIIIKMLHGADANADTFKGAAGGFTDTAKFEGGWAEGYINWCASLGIVKGYGDGTFKPGNKVTAAEAVTMILNALKIDAGEGTWPVTVMAKAEEVKFFADLNTKPASDKALSREELAVVSLAGLEYSPDGKQTFEYDGKTYDSFMDAYMVAGEANAGDIVPTQGDSLAGKVFELKTAEGFIVGNQDTGLECTVLSGDRQFDIETGLDQVGHFVKVYYKEPYETDHKPGVTYAVIDECLVVEVDEVIDGTKDYKNAFGKNYSDSANILHIDGKYTIGHTGVIADEYKTRENGGSSYVAGSAAPTGTYVIHEGNIVSYMEPVAVYATTVADMGDYEGEESILLADGRSLANTEGNDEVVEYPGIAIGDYVTYTVAQDMCVINPVSVVRGNVRSVSQKNGVAQIRIESMTFPMFEGTNTTDLETGTDLDFNLTYEFYITHDDELLGYKQSDKTAGGADVVYLLGAYTTKAKDSYGKEIVYTNAQGVNTSGEEVLLVLGVKEPGEDQLGLGADQISQVPEGFYTVTEHTGKEERKAGIQVVDRCEAGYDKEENPYFIGTVPSGITWKSSTVYLSTHHVCDSSCGAIDGTAHTGGTKSIAFYNAATKWITVDGTLGQPLEVVVTPRASMPEYSVSAENAYKFPMLFSKTDSGTSQVEMVILKANKNALASGGSPLFVAPSSLKPVATTADGYLYEVYDGHTGAAKQVVMDEAELSVGTNFYTWIEEDDKVVLLDAQKSSTEDKVYYTTGAVLDSLYEGSRSVTVMPNGGSDYLNGDNVSSAKIIDVRTAEEKAASRVDTITSVARLEVLRKSGKVPVISGYSSSNTCKVLFVTDILVGPSLSEVIYLPAAPGANSIHTVIDANGVEKRVFINEASSASGFVTYINDNGVLKVEANANGVGGSYIDQRLISVSDSGAVTTTDLFGVSAGKAAILDQTGEGITTLSALKDLADKGSDVTIAAQTNAAGTEITLIIITKMSVSNDNCDKHGTTGSVLTAGTTVLTEGNWFLKKDVTAQDKITVSGDVTLCLADHTLTAPAADITSFITVQDGAKLTICGGHAGEGVIAGNPASTGTRGLYVGRSSAGTLTLESGTISGFTSGDTGAGVYVYAYGVFTMNGGAITGNTTTKTGGGLFATGTSALGGATVTINGGTISNNTAESGGGIQSNHGTVTIDLKDVLITGNTAATGSAMYCKGNMTIYSGVIDGTLEVPSSGSNLKILGGSFDADPGHYNATTHECVQIGNKWVVQEIVLPTYTAAVGAVSNGTVTVDPATAVSGSKVTITATPDAGYELEAIEVNGVSVSTISPYQMTLNSDCVVTATFAPVSTHVTCAAHASGTVFTAGTATLSDGVYRLDSDVTTDAAITVSGNVTLCLCDHTLTADSGITGSFFTVPSGAKLTICGGTEGDGVVNGNGASARGILVDSGELVLDSGIITAFANADTAGGVQVKGSTGTFTMNGGSITGNTTAKKGAGLMINAGGAQFIMNGGSITNNSTSDCGGGICANAGGAVVTLNGGTITGNTAKTGGGVYSVQAAGAMTVSGTTITGNFSTNGGDDVCLAGTSSTAGIVMAVTNNSVIGNVLIAKDKTNATKMSVTNASVESVTVVDAWKTTAGMLTINSGTFGFDPEGADVSGWITIADGATCTKSGSKWVVTAD